MENHLLDEPTMKDIDRLVGKVLSGLGNPEPPINLNEVRELLRLDKAYYSSVDQSLLQETVHRLKVGGKQLIKRPLVLLDVIRRFNLNALWLPDRKRILIDAQMPDAKQRWGEAHEAGHSLIPWHEPLMYGDEKRTLSVSCQEQIEAEANYAAARLLFLQDRFIEEVRSGIINLARIQKLHRIYGNTLTTTLWRTVESLIIPGVGLISSHPQEDVERSHSPIRHFLRSTAFREQFASVTAEQVFVGLCRFCYGRRGPIGAGEMILTDVNDTSHVFLFECFNNSYDTLAFGLYQRLQAISQAFASKG